MEKPNDVVVFQVSTAPLKDPLFLHSHSRMKEKRALHHCQTGFRAHTLHKPQSLCLCSRENHVQVKWHWPVHYRIFGWLSVGGVSRGTQQEQGRSIQRQQVQKEAKWCQRKQCSRTEWFVFCYTGVVALFIWLHLMGGASNLNAGLRLVSLAAVH